MSDLSSPFRIRNFPCHEGDTPATPSGTLRRGFQTCQITERLVGVSQAHSDSTMPRCSYYEKVQIIPYEMAVEAEEEDRNLGNLSAER